MNAVDMTTPLLAAIIKGSPSAVQVVLLQRPDVNERSAFADFTPLHFIVKASSSDSKENGRIIALLHQAGADLEARALDHGLSLGGGKSMSAKRFTPLHMAATTNKPLCVSALVMCGADVHAADGDGRTALHLAALLGWVDVAKILLEAGGDPNRPDAAANTPVSLAGDKGHSQLRKMLADHSSRPGQSERAATGTWIGRVVRSVRALVTSSGGGEDAGRPTNLGQR